MIDKQKVIDTFDLIKIGGKGWMHSSTEKLSCPNCNQSDEFNLMFSGHSGILHCLHSNTCNRYSINLHKYLRLIGRDDLITNQKPVSLNHKLEDLHEENESLSLDIPEKKKPYKFQYLYYDTYLEDRGFECYELFHTGKSDSYVLRGYIVFLLYQNNVLVGWVARSKKSKEWHQNNLKAHKEDPNVKLELRYKNSPDTDFSKILGGYDEITENTHTVWLVEGIMDCENLYKLYDLENQEEIKCCFTFGNKVSEEQIQLLRNKRSVKNLVILYDYGTIDRIKKYGIQLIKYFNVFVGEFTDKEIDAGDADKKYMDFIFLKKKNFLYFYKNRLS